MKSLKKTWLLAVLLGLSGLAAQAQSSAWEKPAADLAEQIANILGPGQAKLTIRNLSSIPTGEIPAIRRLLTQDLKSRGVNLAGAESANTVRVTLSENSLGRLWVAEIGEGNVTQVAFVQADDETLFRTDQTPQYPVQLRKVTYLSSYAFSRGLPYQSDEPVLNTMELDLPVALQSGKVTFFVFDEGRGLINDSSIDVNRDRVASRDPRGILIAGTSKNSFTAFLPGTKCAGTRAESLTETKRLSDGWKLDCHPSDDPWPIAQLDAATPPLKAFYNASRNYFSGVVAPSVGVDLPPFYSAALVPRASGANALLIGGIDGRVQLAENSALHPVAGARDWGSDFAVLRSGCGAGAQIVSSGSGEAANDSLRAYELPALEAVPASAPLAMEGTVTALWTAPDGKSVLAVVRNASNQYEVDRVTALCN